MIIRKDDQGKQTETEVDLKKVLNRETEDLQMRASDILYIPDNRGKEALIQSLQICDRICHRCSYLPTRVSLRECG